MVCHVCGKYTDPKYFFCYECYKKKNRGEIIKCVDCNYWQLRSKYDSRRCPGCYKRYLIKNKRNLHENIDQIYLVNKSESNDQSKPNIITKKLIDISSKRKHLKSKISKREERIKKFYHSIHNRDQRKQRENGGWGDGGYY